MGVRVAVVAAVLASGAHVGAQPPAAAQATCAAAAPSAELERLLGEIAERDRELAKLRGALGESDDDAHYEMARRRGVVEAVRASGLPERSQRRVAIAIVREAELHGLDPLLVVAVIRTESSFNNYAVSPVGAMGLMQVMPDTGKWLLEKRGQKLGRSTNLFDSELNIELGTGYLAQLIKTFGAVDKALVAYNAGPAAARRILKDQAARTRFLAGYPKKVIREMDKLRREADGRRMEQAQAPEPDGRG